MSDQNKEQHSALPLLLDLAHELADLAGAEIMPYFRALVSIDNKDGSGGFDPVTVADRAAEAAIRLRLEERCPEHGIIGEEFDDKPSAGRYQWVIDPIDGTRGFIIGAPMWGTLIGLLDNETPVMGLMDQPFTRERYYADASAAMYRGPDGVANRIATRACAALGTAAMATTDPDLFAEGFERQRFEALRSRVRMTRYSGDCYAYCLLAAGHLDLVVEAGLKPHDIVALIPIVERAGGMITTWDGEPASAGGRIVAAGDADLHAAALEVLSG